MLITALVGYSLIRSIKTGLTAASAAVDAWREGFLRPKQSWAPERDR